MNNGKGGLQTSKIKKWYESLKFRKHQFEGKMMTGVGERTRSWALRVISLERVLRTVTVSSGRDTELCGHRRIRGGQLTKYDQVLALHSLVRKLVLGNIPFIRVTKNYGIARNKI